MEKYKSDVRAQGTMAATGSFEKFNSASRSAMLVSQISQNCAPEHPELPFCLNGYELQLAKYTTSIKMPANATIVGVVPRFMVGRGFMAVQKNNHKTIIFFNEKKHELDVIETAPFSRTHDIFANELKEQQVVRTMAAGMRVAEGTLLAKTNTITESGLYSQSLNANVVYLSDPACIEDGIRFNTDWLARARPLAAGRVTGEWGSTRFPRNLYGDDETYRPMPGNGEKIREDGLVFALCKYDPIFDCINMLPEMLREPDRVHDQLVHVPPDARDAYVTNVDVIDTTKDTSQIPSTPIGMETMAAIYANQKTDYFNRILDICEEYQRKHPKVKFTDALTNLLYKAYGNQPNSPRSRINKHARTMAIKRVLRGVEVDEYHVRIDIAWRFNLDNGCKGSGTHGYKGVGCRQSPPEDMYTDEFGNVADIAFYGAGCIARLNAGQLYEQYIGAFCRDVRLDVIEMVNQNRHGDAFQHILGALAIISPPTYEEYLKKTVPEQLKSVEIVVKGKLQPIIPDDNDWIGVQTILDINKFRTPNKGRVRFRNFKGEIEWTRTPALIGPVQFFILDKSSFKPMSVAVARRNNFGLPSTQNKSTKVAYPTNVQAPRVYAEDEIRSLFAVAGGTAAMNIIEVSTNPVATEMAVTKGYNADSPTNVRGIIDRNILPVGSGRNTAFVESIMMVGGIGITNTKGGE